MRWSLGVEENPSRLERTRGNNDGTCIGFTVLVRDTVDVMNALRLACGVHHYVTHDSIADQCKFPGAGSRGKGDGRTIEVRSRIAASLALVAIVTSGAPTMLHGEVGDAVGHHPPAKFVFNHFLG
jgi:hypothetical protein